MITLIEDFDGRHSETKLEITEPLREAGKAYVKFGRWIDKAVLEVDGKEVVSKIKPGSPLARVQR